MGPFTIPELQATPTILTEATLPRGDGRTLLLVVAHADDGAIFAGGVLALWARAGWRIHALRVTDDRWDLVVAALRSPLFETPIAHFLLSAFLGEGIDEFMSHLTALEASLGRFEDAGSFFTRLIASYPGSLIAERATKEKASIAGMKNEDPSKQTKDESKDGKKDDKPAEGGEKPKEGTEPAKTAEEPKK